MSYMVFPARLSDLHAMVAFVGKEASAVGFGDQEVWRLQLAAEEALVNIIEHAYDDDSGDVEIRCQPASQSGLEMAFIDHGQPFNPMEVDQPYDMSASLEERPVGGLGVFLIKQLMDDIAYERRGDTNVLTMWKNRA